ncbi:hypothetical protein M231_04479 [Tremella mesenterica]|uniref:Uncharacterized protein n=1 Tax=Tremella mesenterica TaxID=5217 RepID=A0A4Q1BKS8_TREME|nr:hypothetical protein M231_04479 [Tremella mesenterica]
MNLKHLDALELAAIATAGLAVLLLLITLLYFLIRHLRKYHSTISIPFSISTKLFHSHEPTTPSASTDATLVTPSGSVSSRLKKPKSKSPTNHLNLINPKDKDPMSARSKDLRSESEEIVMVTYEDGLARMGLKPHHILYADPPPFDQISPRSPPRLFSNSPHISGNNSQMMGTSPRVDRSSRRQISTGDRYGDGGEGVSTVPALESTIGGAGMGTREIVNAYREMMRRESRNLQRNEMNGQEGSPRISPGRKNRREREESDREEERNGSVRREGESVWLPSYYQTSLSRGIELAERDRPWDRPGGRI